MLHLKKRTLPFADCSSCLVKPLGNQRMMRLRWLLAFSGRDLPTRLPEGFLPFLSAFALKAKGFEWFFLRVIMRM